jgi:hypothetical protein
MGPKKKRCIECGSLPLLLFLQMHRPWQRPPGQPSPISRLRLPQRQSRGEEDETMCFVRETGEESHRPLVQPL